MIQLTICSKELSSLSDMDELFQGYCKERGIALDFSKGECCNGYSDAETASAFVWFIRGLFFVVPKGD